MYEIHLNSEGADGAEWFKLKSVKVKYLSDQPDIPDNVLSGVGGKVELRVVARNKAGLGTPTVTEAVFPDTLAINCALLPVVCPENRQHLLYQEEHIFLADHSSTPKDSRMIRKCIQLALADIRSRGRTVDVSYHHTDTGGENWGVKALSMYAHSMEDFGTIAVWCPTAAQHSGQLSDASGGTFKKWINMEAAAGNLRGVKTACELVRFCQKARMFSESGQSRYLNATSMRRKYYYLTEDDVLDPIIQRRVIGRLKGNVLHLIKINNELKRDSSYSVKCEMNP